MKKTTKQKPIPASPATMMRASAKASSSKGYFYGGGFDDGISKRLPEGSLLGGGSDFMDGMGNGSPYPAAGPGIYAGTGLINGVGRMFSSMYSGSAGGFQYLKHFSSNSSFNHLIMAACQAAYLQSGIVQSVIDLYADFATEDLDIYHPDKSVRNFYKVWAQKVNLKSRVHDLFLNLFISANVFIYRSWAELGTNDKRAMQRAESGQEINNEFILRVNNKDKAIKPNLLFKNHSNIIKQQIAAIPPTLNEEQLPENSGKNIPWGYTFLNPLQIDIRGSRIQNNHYWVLLLDKKDSKALVQAYNNGNKIDLSQTQINLPEELAGKLKLTTKNKNSGYYMELELDSEQLSVVQRPGKFDWFAWGVPFVYPALKPLMFKDCLRNMEMKIAETAMKMMYLFKLGDTKGGFAPEDEHFERFGEMLQMPANVGYLIWNDLVQGQILQPDLQNAFNSEKHQSAKEDVLMALGVPEVLIGGKGASFSNAYIAVAGVLEKLESYRDQVMTWLMGECKIIADAMGFRRLPEITFGRTSLTDERSRQQFLLQLYDRNIISADSVLQEAETNVEIETTKKEEEQNLTETGGLMERKGPFDKPEPMIPAGRPGGSQTGPTGQQKNKRKPKGINLASTLEYYDIYNSKAKNWLDQIENFCNNKMTEKWSKAHPNDARIEHVKQLKKQERERLEQLIYNIFSNLSPTYENDNLSDDFIINMLQSDAANGVKSDVYKIYNDKVMEYNRQFGKMPSRELRRQFMTSSWSQMAVLSIKLHND